MNWALLLSLSKLACLWSRQIVRQWFVYITWIQLSSGEFLGWSVTRVSPSNYCTEHTLLCAVWHQNHSWLSNHVFSKRKERQILVDQLLVYACRRVNEEYIPVTSGDTSVLCWASTLPSSSFTRCQLNNCKCCTLNSTVDLVRLLAPVRPRSTGISPHVLCCRSCLWLLG